MLLGRVLFFFLSFYLVSVEIQINLHLTDWPHENNDIQHDCLNVAARVEEGYDIRQIISYCMGEWPSKFDIIENNLDQKFNFSQLSKQNVTTEQLYRWSASVDLIEEYQIYLDEFLPSDKTQLATKIFYNCTLPYFGSKCQYSFDRFYVNHLSLNEIIYDYYFYNRYKPTQFTCYMHLDCDRGPSPSCLDWTEICDGKVHCLNGGIDEKDCWQLEIHQCEENEFKCSYGQCIPRSFVNDNPLTPDCLDQFDEEYRRYQSFMFVTNEPIFKYEDVSCGKFHNIGETTRLILTSSCEPEREILLAKAMFSIKPSTINNECWTALKCIIQMPDSLNPTMTNFFYPPPTSCSRFCQTDTCNRIIQQHCPPIMYVPAYPILDGHVYLAYDKTKLKYTPRPFEPTYVCYDDKRLHVPNDGKTILLPNNRTCRLHGDSKVGGHLQWEVRWLQLFVAPVGRWLHRVTPLIYNNSAVYNQSITYPCMNSPKWISKSQVFDKLTDCYYGDDEDKAKVDDTHFMKQLPNVFPCPMTNQYILVSELNDGVCNCKTPGDSYCADETSRKRHFEKTISFQTICDKTHHLLPHVTDDKNETDETNCEYWPSLHVYNRCDGIWHFLNGTDEIDCDLSLISLLNCSKNSHICVSIQTKDLICLPIEKVNDGIIHCIGAADEPTFCKERSNQHHFSRVFFCKNHEESPCIQGNQLCDGEYDCVNGEDEQVCQNNDLEYPINFGGICTQNYQSYGSVIAKVLCRLFYNTENRLEIYFTFNQNSNTAEVPLEIDLTSTEDFDHIPAILNTYQTPCHRGFPLQIWLNKEKNLTHNICLCPPSFYGRICQYQNQRLSITLQFRAPFNSSQIPFIFIISLIDDSNERMIHSSEQFTYLFTKDCQRKFNFYLLYSTRPKNFERQYSIHIDIYEQITLHYRGSFSKSVDYSFLPVHRLVLQFDIPNSRDDIETCSDNKCINGKCIKYFNDRNKESFCQCDQGWSGKYCTIPYTCLCSSKSLCLGKLANNRSLCVCPLMKMGPRCLINDHICQYQPCMNGGTCIRTDDNEFLQKKFTCICSKDFFGDRCEMVRTKLVVTFDKNLNLSSVVFIHFIEVKINDFHARITTFKRLSIGQNSMIIRWSFNFHIVLIELSAQNYYLMFMQNEYKYQSLITKQITSSDRCLHINELNETFRNYHLLRRIKYYHIPCQTNFSLPCFYDEQQFCLCQQLDHQRLANCFDFDHHSRTPCERQHGCENDGKCLQENSKCPNYFVCQCSECYHGERCQTNINGYSLSLDSILGFYIHSNVHIFHQPRAVLISIIVSTILILGGFLNGILSFITFKNKKVRETGCGLYLLNTSIIILLTMILFAIKFWIVILSQIGTIKNKSFLKLQCYPIDFLLRICLTMDLWLTAFVSIERAFIAIKQINFNQKKTKLIAKYTICILFLIIILTNIHDPIHRTLDIEIDDDEERVRCIVEYKSTVRIMDYIINAFYFIGPFLINLISASVIIIVKTQQRKAVLRTKYKLGSILIGEIRQHKNLLIGPFVLLILVIPRLIITFASGCMKSADDAWLFLSGYFISLVPPILTFILFVLPSTIYKQEFRNAINRYRRICQRSS